MYCQSVFVAFSIICSFSRIKAKETSAETSKKLFADLCVTPSPSVVEVSAEDLIKSDPRLEKTVWYIHIGNDVEKLFVSRALKGTHLSTQDDLSDICYTYSIDHAKSITGDGIVSGFGNRTIGYVCKRSLYFHGGLSCDYTNSLRNYHENVLLYINHVDTKTFFQTYINCYPNGQVGWGTTSKSPKLTEKQKKFALKYAEELGFPKDTTAVLYGDNCMQ